MAFSKAWCTVESQEEEEDDDDGHQLSVDRQHLQHLTAVYTTGSR